MSIAPGQEDTGAVLEAAETAAIDGAVSVKGRSPWQIFWARLKRDKVTVVALIVSCLFLVVGAISPFLARWGVLNPDENHPELVQDLGSMPGGFGGGMSWQHPLGVEPGTGRDMLSRIL